MAVKYERIVAEDLYIGVGPVDVTMPAGGLAVGHRIGPQTFPALAFEAFATGGQAITGGNPAAMVVLANESYDTAGWFGSSGIFAPEVSALYQINAYLEMGIFNGITTFHIAKNGVPVMSTQIQRSNDSGKATISALVPMNGTTDTVTITVEHNDGTNVRAVNAAIMQGFLIGSMAVA